MEVVCVTSNWAENDIFANLVNSGHILLLRHRITAMIEHDKFHFRLQPMMNMNRTFNFISFVIHIAGSISMIRSNCALAHRHRQILRERNISSMPQQKLIQLNCVGVGNNEKPNLWTFFVNFNAKWIRACAVCTRLLTSSIVYPIKLDTFQLRNCGRLESIFWLPIAMHWNTTIKHKLDEDDTTDATRHSHCHY